MNCRRCQIPLTVLKRPKMHRCEVSHSVQRHNLKWRQSLCTTEPMSVGRGESAAFQDQPPRSLARSLEKILERGNPPDNWLRIGNCRKAALLATFSAILPDLRNFLDEGQGVIEIR